MYNMLMKSFIRIIVMIVALLLNGLVLVSGLFGCGFTDCSVFSFLLAIGGISAVVSIFFRSETQVYKILVSMSFIAPVLAILVAVI